MNLLLIFCALFIAADGYQFRFDYSYYQELDGWLKLHENAVKWPEARLRCMREGAVLASPENEKLQAAMKRLMGQKTYIYTGIHSTDSIGYFYSVEGKPVSRMPVTWLANEPITSKGEACTYMTAEGISAYNCSVSLSFICYKKRNPGEKLTDCGTFDLDYTMDERTGKCYKFHTEPQKWANAFATCSGEGGHLAIINSDTEAQVLKELYAKHPPNSMPGKFDKHIVHMGFRDWGDHGLWRTIHGQSLKEAGYDKWAPSQPDNLGGGQFCGGIFQSGELDDLWCEGTYPFICEKDPDSLLDDQYEELVKAKYPWEAENPL